jgi:nitrogen regulatory protein PII
VVVVHAVVLRDRVQTVRDAVEEQTGHVGVTVTEAIGHGRRPGITREYRGRVFEIPVPAEGAAAPGGGRRPAESVMDVICDAARTGDVGSGIVWSIPAGDTRHIRTRRTLEDFGE